MNAAWVRSGWIMTMIPTWISTWVIMLNTTPSMAIFMLRMAFPEHQQVVGGGVGQGRQQDAPDDAPDGGHEAERDRQSHEIALSMREPLQQIGQRLNANVKIVEVPPGPPVQAPLVAEVYGLDYQGQIQVAGKGRTPKVIIYPTPHRREACETLGICTTVGKAYRPENAAAA